MNKKIIVLFSLIALSIGTIAYLASKENSFQLIDVKMLVEHPDSYIDENIRVRGFVKLGSLKREGTGARFLLELDHKEYPVVYSGMETLPDVFKEGVRVRVDGRLENGILKSDHIEAKCASKYEANYKE